MNRNDYAVAAQMLRHFRASLWRMHAEAYAPLMLAANARGDHRRSLEFLMTAFAIRVGYPIHIQSAARAGNFDCERLLDLKRQVDVLWHMPPRGITPRWWERILLVFVRRRVWRDEDQTITYKRAFGKTFILKAYP